MKKKTEKNIPAIAIDEPVNKVIVVVAKGDKKKKTRLIDCVKFGAGFYIGFGLARTIKHIIKNRINK